MFVINNDYCTNIVLIGMDVPKSTVYIGLKLIDRLIIYYDVRIISGGDFTIVDLLFSK